MDKASESGAYTYSREEMLVIRENALSRTRPSYLSTDFNKLVIYALTNPYINLTFGLTSLI